MARLRRRLGLLRTSGIRMFNSCLYAHLDSKSNSFALFSERGVAAKLRLYLSDYGVVDVPGSIQVVLFHPSRSFHFTQYVSAIWIRMWRLAAAG